MQSPVLSARFSPFSPHIVAGGTYSGQILIWDDRAKSLPVLKSPMSNNTHTHPVFQVDIVGTQHAHNIVSVSSDGLVCSWALDMLNKPLEVVDLNKTANQELKEAADDQEKSKKVKALANDFAVTCFDFQPGETKSMVLGTEEGNLYKGSRHDKATPKEKIQKADAYRGHGGPVTAVHFHPGGNTSVFGNLILTSSMDWSVKLWELGKYQKPLRSFDEFGDYVLGAAWSPVHPALFSAVDAEGRLSLWNLNQDTDLPVKTLIVCQKGLNKVKWNKDGSKTAVASLDGTVYIHDVGDLGTPKAGDSEKFQKVLDDFRADQVASQ